MQFVTASETAVRISPSSSSVGSSWAANAAAVLRAKASFELEPLVGFRLSQAIAFALAAASFALGKALHIHETVASEPEEYVDLSALVNKSNAL